MKLDCDTMLPIFKAAATISVGLHAGGCLYINIVEHKARMAMDTRSRHKEWDKSHKLASKYQRQLALIAGISSGGVYYCQPSVSATFLLGGVSIFLLFPYTLFVLRPAAIEPIDDEYDKIIDLHSEDFVNETISKWNWYHALRSGVSMGVFVAFVAQILRKKPFF